MTAALQLVSSTAVPDPVPLPRVQIVSDCRGYQWLASPAMGTVYILRGTPTEVGRRLSAALAAYTGRRPKLALVGGDRPVT